MNDTVGVIALDAADYQLVGDWKCDNILLNNNNKLESFTYGTETPSTLEVWPTVATGVHPKEHGIINKNEKASDWENPILQAMSTATKHLPLWMRAKLGKPFHLIGEQMTFDQTEMPHVFKNGYVFSWPGITPATNLSKAWNLSFQMSDGDLSKAEFEGELFKLFGSEMGYLVRMAQTDAPIVGVHSHILDISGHAYMNHKADLKQMYERVNNLLGWVRSQIDRLVIISDHGMQVEWIDHETGQHSMRSMVATTEKGSLPDTVFDVKEWLENMKVESEIENKSGEFDTTKDQLEALGYR